MARSIKTVMPVESMIGKMSPIKATKWKRYNETAHFYVGFRRSYSNINRFQSRVNARSTDFKASEIAQQTKFAVVSAAANEVMADVTKEAKARVMWKAQVKYVTVRGMVFSMGWELYNPSTQEVDWGDIWD